jgi:hypothetical protein
MIEHRLEAAERREAEALKAEAAASESSPVSIAVGRDFNIAGRDVQQAGRDITSDGVESSG